MIIPIIARAARPLYGLRYGSSLLTTRWLYTVPYSSSSAQPSVLRRSACCPKWPPPLQPPAPAPPQYAIRMRLRPLAMTPLLVLAPFGPARTLLLDRVAPGRRSRGTGRPARSDLRAVPAPRCVLAAAR